MAKFRVWSEGEHADSTRVWYESHLTPLLSYETFARMKAADLSAWIAGLKIGQSTKRGTITVVKSLYSFAAQNCRIKNDPIRHMERPRMKRRGV